MKELLDIGEGLFICKAGIENFVEQEMNARIMDDEKFESLKRIVKKDNRLESLPFCYKDDDRIKIISGHHRYRAALQAGLKELYFILEKNKLSKEDIVYKQLYHNQLDGEDAYPIIDLMLKEIRDQEKLINLGFEYKLDDCSEFNDVKKELKRMIFVFLKKDFEVIDNFLEELNSEIDEKNIGSVYLVDDKSFSKIRKYFKRLKKEIKVNKDKYIIERIFKFAMENFDKFKDFIDIS